MNRLNTTSNVFCLTAVLSLGLSACSTNQSDKPEPSFSAPPISSTNVQQPETSGDTTTPDEPTTTVSSVLPPSNKQGPHTSISAAAPNQPSKNKKEKKNPQPHSGRSKADFPYYTYGHTGTAPSTEVNHTTPQFGRAVYEAFIEHWIATGDPQPELEVVSPADGFSYSMSCSENVQYSTVLCTGGRDAKVYIYRPIDDSVTKPMDLQYG
ncbi:hypothetical protein [Corynebacterium kefirresidentii]|uniref:hypothetical protein n=1 Tax=Corynebacterium kefirresidentii TaxID=1979527 RepID=UPI002650F32E|nr:hypothetical protein [Corynebacterium kefirresidentii]MDN8634595.1 hypothetical protein [Corynebacterium kefirresidentii]